MKKTSDIITRSIVLLALAERIHLETLEKGTQEREEDKQELIAFLEHFEYIDSATTRERKILYAQVGSLMSDDCYVDNYSYYCLGVLLWSIGMVKDWKADNLNYYELLSINEKHDLKLLEKKSVVKDIQEVLQNSEISMLMHWRTRTLSSLDSEVRKKGIKELFINTFGEKYKNLGDVNIIKKDLAWDNRPFYEYTDQDKAKIDLICFWKHYAFEWLTSKEEWDDVHTTT